MSDIGDFWFVIVNHKTDPDKSRKGKRARKQWSEYRDSKQHPHRTINGVGEVGRLIGKKMG